MNSQLQSNLLPSIGCNQYTGGSAAVGYQTSNCLPSVYYYSAPTYQTPPDIALDALEKGFIVKHKGKSYACESLTSALLQIDALFKPGAQ